MTPELKRKNEAAIEHIADVVLVIKRQKRWTNNAPAKAEFSHHETPRKNHRRKRATLILEIEQELYRTNWGKHYARQGQVHAAAKKIAQQRMSA